MFRYGLSGSNEACKSPTIWSSSCSSCIVRQAQQTGETDRLGAHYHSQQRSSCVHASPESVHDCTFLLPIDQLHVDL